ncbi:TPA: hypothetical protein U1B91_000131 [Streptococcus suis]|nr:hypothetical protein [Streptococcus suis]
MKFDKVYRASFASPANFTGQILLNMLARINRDAGTLQNVGKLDDLLASLSADEQGVRFLESPLAMNQVKILLQEEYSIHLAYQQDRDLEVAFGIETDEQMYASIGKFLDDLLDMEKRYLILHKIIKSIKNMTLTEKLEYYQDEANRRK